jgi:hypothetical protein
MKTRIFDIGFLIIAIIVPIISFVISVVLNDAQWFERSGSLTVLFSAIVDSILPGTQNRFDETIAITGLVTVVLGTIIWGYGSSIYTLIH